MDGDLDQNEYQRRRRVLLAELTVLPDDEPSTKDAGEELASYLNNTATCCSKSTPNERNELARELFDEVLIVNKQAVAISPRPCLELFFEYPARQITGNVSY